MAETPLNVDYSDLSPDKVFGRAPLKLCELATPGGRKLADAFYAPRCVGQSDEDCPPWYWAQLLVKQAITALRDAGWTVEPPSSICQRIPDVAPEGQKDG